MDKLKEIIELITRKVIKDNKFLSAVPCKVIKSNEDDSFVVKTFSSGAEYKVYNYSGSKVDVGDNVQVFYQDGLGSQSSYIGCSLYKESVLSINDVILTGNKTSVDIKMPFLIVAGETYVIDGTEMTARTGASIMAIGGSKAVGALSLAIGVNTIAKGDMSFASGMGSKAVGNNSFAIGAGTQAIGDNSFAGGSGARAVGTSSFSFGGGTQANGNFSVAVGGGCITNGLDSFASGCEVIADSDFQTVIGKYNTLDSNDKFAFIIGNGTKSGRITTRSNAFAVDWNGNIYINNSVTGVNLNNIVSQLSDKISESDISQLRETVSNNAINISKNKNALVRLVDSSWKNLLNTKLAENYSGQSSYPISQSGIDYVLDNTNKIVISGTANATSVIRIPITLPAGNYHVNGVPVGGSDSTYHADLREQGTDNLIVLDSDYGAGFDISVSNETIADYCIQVESDCILDNVEFAPMICELVAWNISQIYQPYRPNYQELYTRVLTLENTINS